MRIYTSGLLSKWGFGDGDLLWDFLYDHGIKVDDEPVLVRVVREHVLPAIDQQVDVYEVCTIHNPLRARAVDGVEWDSYTADTDGVLTPEYVDVPDDVIIAIAREEAAR